ncbi:MAG TPA: Hsp20/alpha crystallin family protein [Saprospiraceae bacterium]|nr:Hsp20/alpha crystallin family protein [Saprospiraceae bacterium]HMP25434.1 Hsp20/alpha crystallin family protein [Saprospiraceae bacterium]
MNIIKYDPMYPAKSIRSLFDEFFNWNIADVLGSDFLNTTPSVNILETDADYKIEVAAPGLEKNDFAVSIDNGFLRISANREHSDETQNGSYKRREFSYTAFSRSFQLPEHVDADRITAEYTQGVLKLALPKLATAQLETARTIEIK